MIREWSRAFRQRLMTYVATGRELRDDDHAPLL